MSTAVQQTVRSDGYALAEWSSIVQNENGQAANMGTVPGIKTVQVTGSFSTATLALKGSMDGTTWFTLHAVDMDTGDYFALSALATAYLGAIVENPLFIRPEVTNSGTPDIKVVVGGSMRV